ncbi:MAG: putative metal-binding motif-containing protein [Deltaproteobacteria bacterium]|nr:putative metal-binding motif-containing protein [Deltaproteobacteria bacterium]
MKHSLLRAVLTIVLGLSFAFVGCGDDGETAIWLRIVSPDIEIDQINLSFFDSTASGPALATEEIPLGLSKEYPLGATNTENQLWILIYAGEDTEQRLTIEAMGLRDGREVGNGQAAGLQFEPGKIIEAPHVLTLSHAGEDEDKDGFYTPPLSVYPLEDEELSLYDCDDNNEDINPEAQELCDTIDNDCDKSIDEGCGCDEAESPRACYPQWADEPRGGTCTAGTQECIDGTWADCVGVVIPAPERCADTDADFQCSVCGDGLDNDCDGFVDIRDPGRNPDVPNDPANALDLGCGGCFVGTYSACYTGPEDTQNTGLCRDGQAECIDGTYGECIGEVLPLLGEDGLPSEGDLCDGFDNDCDGNVDDMDIRPACADEGLRGVCNGTRQICEYAIWAGCTAEDYQANALLIICGSETPPPCCNDNPPSCLGYTTDENDPIYCDGFDNDCSGGEIEVDVNNDGIEDCVCDNGETRPCYTGVEPPDEGECVPGVETCVGGAYATNYLCVGPVDERCDALDNDCDGNTDGTGAKIDCPASQEHANWQTCDMGQCIFICHENHWDINQDLGTLGGNGCEYPCTLTEFIQERCDGLDNDCDLLTDADELAGVTDPAQRRSIIDNLCPPRMNATVDPDGVCFSPYRCTYICDSERGDCITPDLDNLVPALGEDDSSNGCETDLRGNPSHCGACGNTCDPNEICNGLSCRCGSTGPDCAGNNTDYCCGTTCTDLRSDESNCGGCGTICQTIHGTNTCINATCTPSCDAGWGNCDLNNNNGCETYLWEDDACGSSCESRPNCNSRIQNASGAFCNEGSCDYAQCSNDHGNCDGNRDNGCETYLWSTSACGTTCDSRRDCNTDILNANIASCNGGSCAFAGCHDGFANCDDNPSNGCERDIWEPDSCSAGCFGAVDCTVLVEHASNPSCPNGSCAFGSCHAGWDDCDPSISNGCEEAIWLVNNCGSDCNDTLDCNTTVVHASGIDCLSGTCTYTSSCIDNHADCTGGRANGCETPLGTNANCGSCGDNCQADSTCTGNVCTCDHLACVSDCCAWGEVCYNSSCCMPNCTSRECGSDGCGDSCGTCSLTGETCNGSGLCVCDSSHTDCDGNQLNGCECDTSDTNVCYNNACCTPNCSGRECGTDGCGGSCGNCGTNEECNAGTCECDANHEDCDNNESCECDVSGSSFCYNNFCCTPNCSGRECGTDGCGGSCGNCDANEVCNAGTCECDTNYQDCDSLPANGCECDVSGTNVCFSNACCAPIAPCGANNCGFMSDNCGGSVNCGSCTDSDEDCESNNCTCNNTTCGSDCCAAGQICDGGDSCCTPVDPCGPNNCGIMSNGCGGTVNCGSCADSDKDCESNNCVCNNTTCNTDCCAAGQICDGGNSCCTPVNPCGFNNCGSMSDGCGGTVNCGSCADSDEDCESNSCTCNNTTCGSDCCAAGQICDGGDSCCTPVDPCGPSNCGFISNGCGGMANCGSCADSDKDCESNNCVCNNTTCDTDCCAAGQVCDTGDSCCTIDCSGKECGDDGCGGTCGSCVPVNEVCNASDQCVCAPNMADCDGEEANGCETNITSNADHCGDCNWPCGSAQTCTNSICSCANEGQCTDWLGGGVGWTCVSNVCTPP